MTHTPFFRLLKTPIEAKGDALAAQIAALNAEGQAEETFTLDPAQFALIPGSPFAYWVSDSIRERFVALPRIGDRYAVRQGMVTANDFRFVRDWWEVPPATIAYSAQETRASCRWAHFAKGGDYSPFYADVHLVVDWENEGEHIRNFFKPDGRLASRPQNIEFFFRPGLTWPNSTTLQMSTRVLPEGCIFGHMGPSTFVDQDGEAKLMTLLGIMSSACFRFLVSLQLGLATAGRKHYEVGIIQRTPLPPLTDPATRHTLAALARQAHDLQRDRDRSDETTHAFCLPALVSHRTTEDAEKETLRALCASVAKTEAVAQARLAALQSKIDDLVFDLYGLDKADRALVRAEMGQPKPQTPVQNPKSEIQNLLMWCVGVAFGRWDVRLALDPSLLPALPGPFEPLPCCAPGALVGADGLPPTRAEEIAPEAWLRARQTVLDLPSPIPSSQSPISQFPNFPIAWDGILVDDPTHPSDIVTRVRQVLALLWGDRADAIEREACNILGVRSLRDYFRDPRKGFFAFHIKRYSKSRRKAPIYWLLQSARRNYGLWLYYPRLGRASLYAAGRDYADVKVVLEETRLQELRQGPAALDGSARRRREREIERQETLVAEVTEFRKTLDRAALLNLPPDLNDGVLISIAPLRELVPWKEAQKMWEKLVAGEVPWSTMAKQMRRKGLVEQGRRS